MTASTTRHQPGTALVAALMATLISACGPDQPVSDGAPASTSATEPLQVAVSTGALAYCARTIGGDRVEVIPLLRAGDPVPTRESLREAQKADLILLNGAGHEPWLPAVSLPADALLDASEGAPATPEDPHGGRHRHGPDGTAHAHGSPSLVWLDPQVVRHQCERTRQALADRRPAEQGGFAARHQQAQQELSTLDANFAAASRRLKNTGLVAAGSGYRSFARRYDLSMRFTRHRPGMDAAAGSALAQGARVHGSDADVLFLQELDQLGAAEPVGVVVLPEEPSAELGREFRERGLAVVVLDPLWATASEEGFIEGLRSNIRALKALPSRG